MSEENKAVDRRWFDEVWNKGNVSAFPELVSRDLVVHNPPVGIPGNFDGIQQSISIHRAGFPDLHFDIDAQVAEGDQVATLWTAAGTHLGEWVGYPPSGKTVNVQGMSLQTYRDGKLTELWLGVDMLDWFQQLGLVQL